VEKSALINAREGKAVALGVDDQFSENCLVLYGGNFNSTDLARVAITSHVAVAEAPKEDLNPIFGALLRRAKEMMDSSRSWPFQLRDGSEQE
jgi:hypothetical protein